VVTKMGGACNQRVNPPATPSSLGHVNVMF
jgi:hypothetical protein